MILQVSKSQCMLLILVLLASSTSSQSSGVTRSNMLLANRLLSSLADRSNLVLSPLSVLTGLAMVREGLQGSSRVQLTTALGAGVPEAQFRDEYLNALPSTSSPSVDLASMITVLDQSRIRADFASIVSRIYRGQPYRHQFDRFPEQAVAAINKFVEDRTKGKITQFLPNGSVTSNTKLMLVNALHFASAWLEPFEAKSTRPRPFRLESGISKEVTTMEGEKTVGYYEDNDLQFVELAFQDPDMSMIILLPSQQSSVRNVLERLGGEDSELARMVSNPGGFPTKIRQTQVTVQLPKFSVTQSLRLKDALQQTMPATVALFSGQADFSRMAMMAEGFKVGDVFHKNVITVDEKGVEAASATAVGINLLTLFESQKDIQIDRPFIYYIVDRTRNTILFAGILNDPSISN